MARSANLTPQQRKLRAQAAAHALHASVVDPVAHTAPARQAMLDKFERQVDPDGSLPVEDRARRAAHARKAWMLGLALKSAQVRRKRSAA